MVGKKIPNYFNLKNKVFIQMNGLDLFSWDLYGLGMKINDYGWKMIFDYFINFPLEAYKRNSYCNVLSFGQGYSYIRFNRNWWKENKEKVIEDMKIILSDEKIYDVIENYVKGWNYGENIWEVYADKRKELMYKYEYWVKKKKENKNYNRYKIMERDEFKCRICGRGVPEVTLHIDHWIPKSKGGLDIYENLVTLCSECNLSKSATIPKYEIDKVRKNA